jgi:BirA family biotin operon repressor/biotin-[acetyl-CoA-carboxylase] ligase
MSSGASVGGDRSDLPPGFRLVAFDCVGSTNDEAKHLAHDGAEHGTVVWARRQETGRGRRGRAWASPEGNLYTSLILRPVCSPATAAQLSFVAAIALADTVGPMLSAGTACRCKWPNDVLVDDRKIAGILLESEMSPGGGLDWLVLGLGVNIGHCPADTEFPATSLALAGASVASPAVLLSAFIAMFDRWYRRWQDEGFASIRTAWLERARGIGGPVTVRLARRTFDGIFIGMDEDGALIVEQSGGPREHVTAGEVFFGSTAGGS